MHQGWVIDTVGVTELIKTVTILLLDKQDAS